MEQDIKNEFEFLAKAIKEGFDHVDQRFEAIDQRFEGVDKRFEGIDHRLDKMESTMATMATKTELNQLRSATADGFASQQLEISLVQEKLTVLDDKMDKLFRMETEDIQMLDLDMKKVKQRLALT